MIKYTNSGDINHRSIEYQQNTSTANVVRIDPITSTLVKKEKKLADIHCKKCKSINTFDNILDSDGKRHFCRGVDRIAHEENCVIEILKFIEYYNRRELSSFQLELNIH